MNKVLKEKIKQVIVLLIIVIAFGITLSIMFKYKTEGESKLPFNLSKIMIVSSAEAESKDENPNNNKWNLDINQYNDIYIEISKNEDYSASAYSGGSQYTYIKSVKIENINISKPNKGTIYKYMPYSQENKLFSYEDNYEITDSLTFQGAETNNTKQLQISNQGGTVLFRIVNKDVYEFVSDGDDEISYDGTLLEKTGVTLDDIKVSVSFDLVIETDKTTYRGKINFILPCGNIQTEGVSQQVITDFSNVVFKRE